MYAVTGLRPIFCSDQPPGDTLPAREIYTAKLVHKLLLSAASQCFHLEFLLEQGDAPLLVPGQFLSLLAEDAAGKTYTRAYSIASVPRVQTDGKQTVDLCVNRVENGFFSNRLCDMRAGEAIQLHGPHGLFTLKPPPSGALMVAAGTGIAPMRGFIQWLFPEGTAGRSQGRDYWLVYEAPAPGELFYNSYFEDVASAHANFHYVPVEGGEGQHEELARAIARVPHGSGERLGTPASEPPGSAVEEFDHYAYVCGLGEMVKAARTHLLDAGWEKRQILFERYD